MAGDSKVKTTPTQLFLDTSPVIPNAELVNVHPLIKRFFQRRCYKSSRHSSSWKDKSLISKLAKVDFKSEYSVGGGVFEELISCWEKIRRLSPCNQSENVEPFHLIFYN